MNIFSYDSKFSQVLLKIAYGCFLNVLWIACSVPIFTIGASTTALYAVTLKIADNEEGNVTKQFFQAFRDNFKQATVIWLILLAIGIFLGADAFILVHLRNSATGALAVVWTIILAMVIACSIIYTIVLMYVFPLIARVENTSLNMVKNSLLIGFRYLFCSILVFAIHFAMFVIIVRLFTPLALFGEGLCACSARIYLHPSSKRAPNRHPPILRKMESRRHNEAIA
jgi:uncharacterized membrane protein YesL